MKTIIRFVFTLLLFPPLCLSAQQTGVVKGRVFDSKNNEPIPFANVVIWKTTTGTAADENGYFRIENMPLGFNRLEVSSVGYTTKLSEEFMVNTASERTVNVGLEESQVNLEQVTVKANPFRKAVESPVSLQRIGIAEIEKTRAGIEIYRKYYNPCQGSFPLPLSEMTLLFEVEAPVKIAFTWMTWNCPT